MAIGVILNRVFRLNNNPLFDYIYSNKESINHLLFQLKSLKKKQKRKHNTIMGPYRSLCMNYNDMI